MGSSPSLRFELHNYECFAGGGANDDDHPAEPTLSQDCPKDQGEELIEVNLANDREESQPGLLNAGLTTELRDILLRILK